MERNSEEKRRLAAGFVLLAGFLCFAPLAAETGPRLRFKHLGVEDGLSHTTAWDVHQDRRGFVWIGTETSLQRYDGYELRSYQHDPENPSSLSASEVMRIFEDRRGRLWLATREQGVNRYDRRSDSFIRYPLWPGADDVQEGRFIRDLADDAHGNLWIASDSGLIRLDPVSGETRRFVRQAEDPETEVDIVVYGVVVDGKGAVWVRLSTGVGRLVDDRFAVTRLVPDSHEFPANAVSALYEDPGGRLHLATLEGHLYLYDPQEDRWAQAAEVDGAVSDLLAAPGGRLWAATYGDGLFRIDPASGGVEHYHHDPDDRESLASDNVFYLDLDRSGLLWIATRNGISILDPRLSVFDVYRHRSDHSELAGHNVTALFEDRQGLVWIGFEDGHLSTWKRSADPSTEPSDQFDDIDLGIELGSVLVFHESTSGELWAGFDEGFGRIDRVRRRLVRADGEAGGYGVRAMAEDEHAIFWLGTWNEGLVRFDPSTGEIRALRAKPGDPATLASDDVYAVLVDRAGQVWAGTQSGLSRLDPRTWEVKTWCHDPARPEGLAIDQVVDLYEDRAGRLWVATYGGGLDRYDASADLFHHYKQRDGLAHNNTVGILEDDGRLWVSTNQGLSQLDPETGALRNYYAADGLASDVFLIGARLRHTDGRLIFGGHSGLTAFSPSELEDDTVAPPVVITKLLIRGATAEPGAPGSPLEHAIAESSELTLNYRQASFSLEFAAPHFANPRKSRYAFRLENYDPDWIETDAAHRRARYTNLDPGSYVFRVRASNRDGVWNEDGATLRVRILPPPWKTWWAYTLYGVVALAAAVGYERWHRRRLEREQQVNAQLREVDRLKDEFLANTSHELRTPLYGITGLAESLIDGVHGELSSEAKKDLSMIVDSGRRLGGLVNDILDYSRLRDRELDLALKPVDMSAAVNFVLTLLRPLAGGKDLELVGSVASGLPAVQADENRLQQILLNLVGNAVKFTEAGRVEVRAEHESEGVRIEVNDTGIGIAAEHLERIFEPFEQVDAAADRLFSGTGLGLAVTRHLVELHGGHLEASSSPGEGSSFSFTLPVAEEGAADSSPDLESTHPGLVLVSELSYDEPAPSEEIGDGEAGSVLIVDDELVIRQVLANQLSQAGYRHLQAESGQEALEILDGNGSQPPKPDLVLLDIMMPRMSGFEVCREIRRRYSLDELPVIYLTARSRVEDLVQAFSTGANDFLSKPITRDELLSRVRTHLKLAQMRDDLDRLVRQRTAQVETLSGLLPLCANCKKFRDDDGYWNDIEDYFRAHSEVKLTHGLCHDCVQEYYPDIDLDESEP